MEKKLLFLVLFYFSVYVTATQSKIPFWKSKSEVYRSIKEERAIIVSAKTDHDDSGKRSITLITAGRIRAPLRFVHEKITHYSDYSKILPYMDETSYDKETKKLFASGSFLGFKAHATLEMGSKKEDGKSSVDFKITSGFLSGLTGVITEERVEDLVTELSMDSVYTGDASIPGFLLSYGLEFIGHKMAASMRSYVESQWEKEAI